MCVGYKGRPGERERERVKIKEVTMKRSKS